MNTAFENVMREVGVGLGVGELVLEEGRALIGVDDVVVNVHYLEEPDQVLLYAEVAPLPEKGREALYAALLEGQSFFKDTAGATLSVSREISGIFLQIRMLDAAAFLNLLEHFVHVVLYWRKVCAELTGEEAAPQTAAPEGLASMLRV